MMSATLAKDLREKYDVRSMPVRKGDQVKVVVGNFKSTEGKVQNVYRRRRCIYIEKVEKSKVNTQMHQVPIHPSNCVITALKLDKDRKAILEKKKRTAKGKNPEIKKMDWGDNWLTTLIWTWFPGGMRQL